MAISKANISDQNTLLELETITGNVFIKTADVYSSKCTYRQYNNKVIAISINNLNLSSKRKQDALFKTLSKLSSLRQLYLPSCKIKHITHLKNLRHLRRLVLEGNSIQDISPVSSLIELKELWCYENLVEDITPIASLKQLEIVSFGQNKIIDISALANHSKLHTLYLRKNKIRDLSPLRNLTNLKGVALESNDISELPEWISDYHLDINTESDGELLDGYILLGGNPIKYPDMSIVKNGKAAIKRYFKRKREEGSDYIYEAKLTLVGEGGAGKTSLQARLFNPNAKLPKGEERTRGIAIADWEFKKEAGKKHIAHIWDFGGQDVYYPVHRFFITDNSVFVLLASTRYKHHHFDYWIPTIYQFGGNSPIILGQTCHDNLRVPWNDIGGFLANSDFNIIRTSNRPYHELNLPNNNEGLDNIIQTITGQILQLPRYGKEVPKSWVPVRNHLSELRNSNSYISYSSFEDICRSIAPNSFEREIDISDCCQFLHDIGVVLWYAKIPSLRDIVVLKPEWTMNAVYKIIDDQTIQSSSGTIRDSDFNRLWFDDCYKGKHEILKKMLEIFKIAFPKKHQQQDYIIPAKLLSIPSDMKWQEDIPMIKLEYRFDFMPKGIVNQLSAELSRHISGDDKVWNDAVNFKRERAECQVEEDFYNRKIYIKAQGKDARDLIILVMEGLKNITDGYKGIIPDIHVPCTCSQCRKSNKPTLYPYEQLTRKILKKENATVTCNESDEELAIDSLLYRVGLPKPINIEISTSNRLPTKKVFISYSKYDEDYLQEFQDHLVSLKDEGWCTFDCRQIDLGSEWNETILAEIDACDIMICLISVKFLNTAYIKQVEIPTAINKGKTIIPIIIKPCDWETSKLGKFMAGQRGKVVSLNNQDRLNGIIKASTPEERAAFWTDIVKEFRKKLK